MSQHTATHCNTLQHTATRCNTQQHTDRQHVEQAPRQTRHNTLQHTATNCNTLQHTATHRPTARRTSSSSDTSTIINFTNGTPAPFRAPAYNKIKTEKEKESRYCKISSTVMKVELNLQP